MRLEPGRLEDRAQIGNHRSLAVGAGDMDNGRQLVIWANHLLRASIKAMQQTAAQIYQEQSIGSIESQVVTVKEIFRLQNAAELKEAEQRYLPKVGAEQTQVSA
jgi:hypothetical protein